MMNRIMRLMTIFFLIGIIMELSLFVVLGEARDLETNIPFIPTPTATPSPTPAFGKPVKLEIKAIGISAAVEDVGTEPNGQMMAPKDFSKVGWYVNSAIPGWLGSAVFSGHYDTSTGSPAVFFNLKHMPIGAEIIITDEMGRAVVYRVERSESKPVGEWDTREIFGQNRMIGLSLITCSGWWNPNTRNYSHRHIVFARLAKN